jgi:hypothetical protein
MELEPASVTRHRAVDRERSSISSSTGAEARRRSEPEYGGVLAKQPRARPAVRAAGLELEIYEIIF